MEEQESEYASMYAAEFTPVSRTVFLILHDRQRAEDITQDAFIQLYSHWAQVSRYERPGAWVRRVAIRLAVRHQKRERTRAVIERSAEPPSIPQPADIDLLHSMRQLPPAQRAALVLFYYEDRSVAEIASILGWTCRPGSGDIWAFACCGHIAGGLATDEHVRVPQLPQLWLCRGRIAPATEEPWRGDGAAAW